MKRKLIALLLGGMVVAATVYAATATFNIGATLRAPLTLTWVADVTFGTLDIPGGAPTVFTVLPDPAGAHTAGATAAPGHFTLLGDTGATAIASVPASTTMTDGTTTLTVNLSVDATSAGGVLVDPVTPVNVYIGADTTVTNTDTAGAYTGTSTLTVVYQ